MAKSIFDMESEDRVESPERLNEYIRVASPGVWVIVCALVLVFAAFIVWGCIGTIPESVTLTGAVDGLRNNSIDVMVDADQYTGLELVGKEVSFELPDGTSGKGIVQNSTEVPFSEDELRETIKSDFLVSRMVTSDYSYVLDVEPDMDLAGYETQLVDVTIITDEVKPIYYLLH